MHVEVYIYTKIYIWVDIWIFIKEYKRFIDYICLITQKNINKAMINLNTRDFIIRVNVIKKNAK